MINNDKSGIGLLLAVFGIILLIFGIILSLYEKTITIIPPFGTTPVTSSLGYPYQTVGIVLILGGIVMTIIGGYQWQMKQKKEMLKSNVELGKEGPKDISETPNSGYFCKNCGFKNQKDAVFCNQCGKPIS